MLSSLFLAAALVAPPIQTVSRPASALKFTTQPDGAITGTAFTQQPVVTAYRPDGTVDPNFTSTVTITVSSGSGVLSGDNTKDAVAGVATFTDLVLTGAGHGVLQAAATGLTAGKSGYMTVNPTAATAKATRVFDASGDLINCGSGATLDNLAQDNLLTAVVRVNQTTGGDNQYVISKYLADSAGNAGWALSFEDISSTERIVVSMNRATTDASVVSSSSSTISTGTWYDVAFTWDGSAIKIYKATVGSPLTEVSYDGASAQGSGAAQSDSNAQLYIGNLELTGGAVPFLGAIEWAVVYRRALSAAELLQVQIAFDRNNAAMATNIASCRLLIQCNGSGTGALTDQSGNGNSGTPSAGVGASTGETVYAPTVWGNGPNATDQTTYLSTSSHSTVSYTTSATSVTLGMNRTATLDATYDAQAAIGIWVNGAYNTQALVTTAGTMQYVTAALPAGAGKLVTFVTSLHTRSGSSGTGTEANGVDMVSARFNNTVTEVIPPTPTDLWLFDHDSIPDGFLADPVGQFGPIERWRIYLASLSSTRHVISNGYGGQSIYKLCNDASARSATVARVVSYNPSNYVFSLGGNDNSIFATLWGSSQTNISDDLSALITDLKAALPNMNIWIVSPYVIAGATNMPTIRNATTVSATAGGQNVFLVNGTMWFDGNPLGLADTIHPNNIGTGWILNGMKASLRP